MIRVQICRLEQKLAATFPIRGDLTCILLCFFSLLVHIQFFDAFLYPLCILEIQIGKAVRLNSSDEWSGFR